MRMSTPLRLIAAQEKRYIDCSGSKVKEIRDCPCDKNDGSIEKCPLHPFRMGKTVKGTSRIKSIGKYCLWCCVAKDKRGIEERCTGDLPEHQCPRFPYRFGKNPILAGRPAPKGCSRKKTHASVTEIEKILPETAQTTTPEVSQ